MMHKVVFYFVAGIIGDRLCRSVGQFKSPSGITRPAVPSRDGGGSGLVCPVHGDRSVKTQGGILQHQRCCLLSHDFFSSLDILFVVGSEIADMKVD